jgi:hypothetical protein
MLPEIGVMVGSYIVVRLLDLLFRPIVPFAGLSAVLQILLKIGAGMAIGVAVFVMIALAIQGGSGLDLPSVK